MNLNEAYLGWQQVKDNGQFYMKTRNDFRRAWLMLPTNKPCSYYTKEVLGEALAASSEAEGVKVRAASVMIQVLEWAHKEEPKECPKVKFTIDDLMAYVRGEVEKPKTEEPVDDDEPKVVMKKGAKKKTDFVPEKKPKKSKASKSGDKSDKSDGEKKHPGGRPTKPVCQIDPDTLEVIATFDSCNAAMQATGASNIDRAVARVRKSAGFYWSTPDGVKTFAERLREKQKADEQRHVEAAGRARAIKMQKIAEQRAQAEREFAASEAAMAAGVNSLEDTDQPAMKKSKAIGGDTRGQAPVSSATDTASQSPCVAQRHNQPERKHEPKVERMPEPKAVGDKGQSKVSEALAVFTDDELIEELDRRGWYGVMRKVMVVELTKD